MIARSCRLVFAARMLLACAGAAPAAGLAADASKTDLKLSPARLNRITDFFNHEVAAGKIPGAIVSIQRRGKPAYFRTFGVRDVKTRAPMTPDTIFRLYSM